MNETTTSSTETVTTEKEEAYKPMVGSWRYKIRSSQAFNLMVDEILRLTCPEGAPKETKNTLVDYCETLWKLGAADKCGVNNKNNKPIADVSISVISDANDNSISSNTENPLAIRQFGSDKLYDQKKEELEKLKPQKTGKNKAKKTTKKSCDC